MRSPRTIFLLLASAILSPCLSVAEVLQSSSQSVDLWIVQEGAETRVHRSTGVEASFELPPGAVLRELEPTEEGWLAVGRMPTGAGTDLLIVEGGKGGAEMLPAPVSSPARHRGQPVLFLSEGRLAGLAWAQGEAPRAMEIWAAEWLEGSWGPAELVSPKGPGSQVAPRGVVLADGSWLLVWAAYDGRDDEIQWSRRVGGDWSAPRRLHADNEVPDLMPAMVATEGGALVVWSWYDGNDYRLKSAQWNGRAWFESRAFGGRGSGNAGLFRSGDRILLLFQSVEPAAWTVRELDLSGARRRTAVVMESGHERPLLVIDEEADRALLRWSTGERPLDWQEHP